MAAQQAFRFLDLPFELQDLIIKEYLAAATTCNTKIFDFPVLREQGQLPQLSNGPPNVHTEIDRETGDHGLMFVNKATYARYVLAKAKELAYRFVVDGFLIDESFERFEAFVAVSDVRRMQLIVNLRLVGPHPTHSLVYRDVFNKVVAKLADFTNLIHVELLLVFDDGHLIANRIEIMYEWHKSLRDLRGLNSYRFVALGARTGYSRGWLYDNWEAVSNHMSSGKWKMKKESFDWENHQWIDEYVARKYGLPAGKRAPVVMLSGAQVPSVENMRLADVGGVYLKAT